MAVQNDTIPTNNNTADNQGLGQQQSDTNETGNQVEKQEIPDNAPKRSSQDNYGSNKK